MLIDIWNHNIGPIVGIVRTILVDVLDLDRIYPVLLVFPMVSVFESNKNKTNIVEFQFGFIIQSYTEFYVLDQVNYLLVWINGNVARFTHLRCVSPRVARHPFSIAIGTAVFTKTTSMSLVRCLLIHFVRNFLDTMCTQ